MRKEILKAEAYELGFSRKQISERAFEIAELIENGSYKNAVACIGRMVTLSEVITDYYWSEKFYRGRVLERYYLKSGMKDEHPDKDTKVD